MDNVSVIPADAPPTVKTPVLAEWLGVSNQTLARWVKKGVLPAPLKLSAQTWLWDVAAVRAALVARLATGAGER